MNTFSKVIVLAALLSASSSFAANKIDLRCTAGSAQECATRATDALTKMSCAPSAVDCQVQREVDGDGNPTGEAIYCQAESVKCAEAKPYLFGGTYCDGHASKKTLVDRKLTLSYAMGVFGWVRSLCIAK